MNERIKQLVEEARLITVDDTTRYASDEEFEQRFAEAVIRECCIALNPMLRDMISRGQGREIILQHFDINPKEISMLMLDRAIDQCKRELAERNNNETDRLQP
jgi:hypothetical protein